MRKLLSHIRLHFDGASEWGCNITRKLIYSMRIQTLTTSHTSQETRVNVSNHSNQVAFIIMNYDLSLD